MQLNPLRIELYLRDARLDQPNWINLAGLQLQTPGLQA